ncbi:hypothetical protein [Myxosarcina sp. GI1(2024)]
MLKLISKGILSYFVCLNCLSTVKSAIEQIGVGKYLWLFKEHILNLFPQEQPKYLEEVSQEEDEIEYIDDSNPNYKFIEELQKEDPDNIAVFHSEEYLEEKEHKVFNPPQPDIPHTPEIDKEQHLVKLADNVVYDRDTDCIHIGFKIPSDGYDWRDELCYKQGLSTKSWFEEAEYLKDYPKELIIEGITLQLARELVEVHDFTKPPAKQPIKVREELYEKPHYPDPKIPIKLADYKEGMTPVNKVEISPEIIYIPVDKTAFVAFSAKQRAYDYGNYLTKILDIAEKATFTHKPQVVSNSKYELKLEGIELAVLKQFKQTK